jgi:hypothetical protein
MARIGSVAAAPFVGGAFVSLYLGATRVPTVPGKPVISSAVDSLDIDFTPPPNGGSEILGYNVYIGGSEFEGETETSPGVILNPGGSPGDPVRIAAVNAIGEGPKSNTVVLAAAP